MAVSAFTESLIEERFARVFPDPSTPSLDPEVSAPEPEPVPAPVPAPTPSVALVISEQLTPPKAQKSKPPPAQASAPEPAKPVSAKPVPTKPVPAQPLRVPVVAKKPIMRGAMKALAPLSEVKMPLQVDGPLQGYIPPLQNW